MRAIELAGVTVTLGGVRVLDTVTMAVERGEVVAIVGPNGAGKTTLLRLMAADLAPEQGSVTLGGSPPGELTLTELARRRAYLAPQESSEVLFSVRDVVAMGRHPHDGLVIDGTEDAIVDEAIAGADVAHLADRPVRTLSTGERQRVGLARVWAQQTPLVLLDEPTASLDLGHREMVMRRVRAHADGGGSVVVVLHDLNLASAYADRLVLLVAGRTAAAGPPSEVLTAETLTRAYGQAVAVVDHPFRDCPLVLPLDDEAHH